MERGFTMVELLVSLAVTVAIVALMFSAWEALGRSEARNQKQIERIDRMAAVSRWLEGKFDALRLFSRQDGNEVVNFFSGNPAGVLWVGPLPERGELGGLFVFRISPLRREEGRVDVGVEILPYTGLSTNLDWDKSEKQILLPGVSTLQWYYQDGASGEWAQVWDSKRKKYPARVRVELADQEGLWPRLVFALASAK